MYLVDGDHCSSSLEDLDPRIDLISFISRVMSNKMKKIKEPWMSVTVERVVKEAKPLASNARVGVDMSVITICFRLIMDWTSCTDFSSNSACVMM